MISLQLVSSNADLTPKQRVLAWKRFALAQFLPRLGLWGVFSENGGFLIATGRSELNAWTKAAESHDRQTAELESGGKSARLQWQGSFNKAEGGKNATA